MTSNNDKEIETLKKIASILEGSSLDLTSQIGVLEILKHSLIQAAMMIGSE